MLETAYWITQALLSIAVVCAVYRVFRGPSVLDRVISVDVILIVVASMFLTDMVIRDSQDYIVFVVGTAVIGFLGAVAIARFVAVRRPESWQVGEDPRTDPGLGGATAAHEPGTPSTGQITTLRGALLDGQATHGEAQSDGGESDGEDSGGGDSGTPDQADQSTSWFQALVRSRMAQAQQTEDADPDGSGADPGEERS